MPTTPTHSCGSQRPCVFFFVLKHHGFVARKKGSRRGTSILYQEQRRGRLILNPLTIASQSFVPLLLTMHRVNSFSPFLVFDVSTVCCFDASTSVVSTWFRRQAMDGFSLEKPDRDHARACLSRRASRDASFAIRATGRQSVC